MMPVFQIANMTFYTYGLLLFVGFILSLFVIYRRIRKQYLDEEKSFDVVFLSVISSVIGARLFYIIEHFDFFAFNFFDWILINANWGFSFWGAAGGYFSAYLLMVKKYKLPVYKMLDLQVIPLNLFWIFAQIAIFLSAGEVGTPTQLPWGVIFFSTIKRHPVSFYKAICLVATVLLMWKLENAFAKKRLPLGTLFFTFVIILSVFFTLVKFFNEEELLIAKIFRPDQFIYLTIALATGILLYKKLGRNLKSDLNLLKLKLLNFRNKPKSSI